MESYPTESLPLPSINYQYKDDDNIISSEESPIYKQIRSYQSGSEYKLIFKFTSIQLSIFESWVYNKLNDGIDWFSMPLKIADGNTAHTIRFKGKYTVTKTGHESWSVAVTVETDDKYNNGVTYDDYETFYSEGLSIAQSDAFHILINFTLPENLGGSGWI